MDNHEIGQIIETTLDSGKKRVVGLRTDGMLVIWNWEKGEWTGFMSPSAARDKGMDVSEALLQAGKKRDGLVLETAYEKIMAAHQDRPAGTSRQGIMR